MQIFIKKMFGMTVISLMLASQVWATNLHIKNEDSAEVSVVIEPGNGTVLPNSTAIKQVVKPNGRADVVLNREILGNSDAFVIKGSVTVPSLYNKCGPLSVDKNYNVTFISGKLGTIVCTYNEVNS